MIGSSSAVGFGVHLMRFMCYIFPRAINYIMLPSNGGSKSLDMFKFAQSA